MRFLIVTTVVLALVGVIGIWIATRKHRRGWMAASAAALAVALVLAVGTVGFPRETCEVLGGNLTRYDSGTCVNELGGTAAGGIG